VRANGNGIAIGDGHWAVVSGAVPATVVVRPEKIAFARPDQANAVSGTVKARIFQGNHWLYQVDTPAGPVIMSRQNTGEVVPGEGEAVRLAWRAEDMGLEPASEGRA
jgi:putative spermidine/putrescine transport system ATP-binding protein